MSQLVAQPAALQALLDKLRAQPQSPGLAIKLQLAELLLQQAARARESVAGVLYQRIEALLANADNPTANIDSEDKQPLATEPSALARLLDEFRSSGKESIPESELDKKILEQNARLIGAIETKPALPAQTAERGLRAAHKLRHQQGRNARRDKVQFALDSRPENPGPLNPHMLAVQILSQIQSVAPGYLERLVTYMDTLAVLDQQQPFKAKKPPRPAKSV